MSNKKTELLEEYGCVNLEYIEPGDTITVVAYPYIHQPEVFADIEDETEEITFTVARKIHPSGSDVNTWLLEADHQQANTEHWRLNDERALCYKNGMDWFIKEIIITDFA